MELSKKYNPSEVEDKWYAYWLKYKFFHSEPDNREPYTVVIPPPNVTGILHMGHVLNNTLNDVLVRKARMDGKNACWVPGTDHASIATENKVVAKLRDMGIRKEDLTREEFLKYAWEWKEEHGGIILQQLRKLGASCDWDRTRFTMEPELNEAVINTFVYFYKKGWIYRGVRMVNWDPVGHTAVSDDEVIHKDTKSHFYHMRYFISDGNGNPTDRYIVVATTRPETIMADAAICLNPNDERHKWMHGKKVLIPLINKEIPIIEDDYVEMDFGTGCLKVTPAHDKNDYMLGRTHNLESIDIFNEDGTLSEAAGMYVGMDRFDVRKQNAEDLTAAGLMEKVEENKYTCSWSQKCAVSLLDEFQPFLRPSQLVDYSENSACVQEARELAADCSEDSEVAAAVYDLLVNNIRYDKQKAETVQSGYLPDPDETLSSKKGICFDYAALAAAMLRSMGIPCKLITGYVGENTYHAWNSFYLKNSGWITVEFKVNANEWQRVDITFAAGGGLPDAGSKSGIQYTTRYTY